MGSFPGPGSPWNRGEHIHNRVSYPCRFLQLLASSNPSDCAKHELRYSGHWECDYLQYCILSTDREKSIQRPEDRNRILALGVRIG